MEYFYALLLKYKYQILLPIAIPEGPIIAVIAAFLAAQNVLNIYVVYIIIVLGDLIGDSIWYWVSRIGGEGLLPKYGHFLKVTEEKIIKAKQQLDKHFIKTMLFGKITNVPMLAIIIASGVTKIDFKKFFLVVFFITIPKALVFVLIGFYFGKYYLIINKYMDNFSSVVAGIFILSVLVYIIYFYLGKIKFKNK